jgi:hypothetical protein
MLGTHEKLDGNIVGFSWEHIRNHKSPTSSPSFKRKKLGTVGACYLTSLVVKNIFAYLCSFPILA